MTCIVGLEHEGKVYIGGDSAGVAGWSLSVRSDGKVFKSGEFVMGFTSSFRMGQLLRHKLSVAEQPSKMGADKFMCTWFIDAVRTCLKDGGYATVNNNSEEGGTFLVGYRGLLYYVGGDFQVGRAACGYNAVGCGSEIALGAMFASDGLKPKRRVTQALSAAEQFSAGVAGPFEVVSL